MLPNEYKPRQVRPMSEIINPARFVNEADVAGNWYEDLQNYERNLDEMASATLDQNFKEEMQHVDQWYRYLTEAEKTATMYTLLQHSSQVQARFFINLLQQMVKRDPLYSLLTPNNPDQDMQNHLAGAMAKAELEASQRLMSVLPYKTGQVMSRPQSNTNRRTVDRHSFALGDTEEYSRLFGTGRSSDLLNHGSNRSSYISLLDESAAAAQAQAQAQAQAAATNARRLNNASNGRTSGRTMFNNGGRPHSVIEGDTNSLFPPATWMNSSNISSNSNPLRRQPTGVGHIGDRGSKLERPKSADISNWSLPTATTSTDSLVDRRSSSHGYPSVWGTQAQQQQQSQQSQHSPSQQHLNSPSQQQVENDLLDFTNSMQQQPFRRRAAVNRIPVVPENDELVRNHFLSSDIDSRSSSPFRKPSSSTGLEHYSSYLMQTPTPTASQQQQQQTLQGIVDNTANLVLDDHEYASDHSDGSHMSRRRSSMAAVGATTRASKDKKAVEVVDMELLKDIPAWLRSLRLHKYNAIFSDCTWQEIVKMSDDDLLKKGVAALGARRKMLKVFENIKAHCDANNIEY
ncbi:hypothetical protein HMPREF1544_00025 [Mucor circinelloides 1006PhL]|uniref:SAM domain-containing protein n=2 Tax=Mucor TaxID=4830 RepID=S2JRV7_MUCC1|nr:hypothetical protein HMPREF1544_00025 [Mucor circinelloides 1006PhL]